MDWLARTLFRFRFLAWCIVLAGSAVLWMVNQPVAFDQSIEGFFPDDHPALLSYQRAKQSFGGDDFVFVAYDDDQLWSPEGMARVRAFAKTLKENVPGVIRVDSLDQMPLPWKVDAAVESLVALPAVAQPLALPRLLGGLSTVASEVRAMAAKPEALAELTSQVCASPLFRNLLVDPRGRATALVVQLKGPDTLDTNYSSMEAVRSLRRQADTFAQDNGIARVALVGPPVLLADGFISLEKDNRTLGIVAMGLMALTMFIAVRSPWWAMLPLVSGGATWLMTQAFLNACDLHLSLSAGPIIAQTVVLCMPAASHLAMHFREALREEPDPCAAARRTLVVVAIPVAWCSTTAALGYLALLSSNVCPVFQFGITMAVCNLLAGTLAYVLAAGAMHPPHWRRGRPYAESPLVEDAWRVGGMTEWVIHHPGLTLGLFVAPCVALAAGIRLLSFESNYIKIYKSGSRVAQDYRFVEDRMGGIGLVEMVFPAPKEFKAITPEFLDTLRETTAELKAADSELVAEVLSLADVLAGERGTKKEADETASANPEAPTERSKSGGLLGGLLGRLATAPASPEQVIQTKLTVLNTPAFAHFLDNFWNRHDGQMRILVRIRESAEAERKLEAFDELLRITRSRLGGEAFITGLSHVLTQVTSAIITTQFQSTGWSCALILFMLMLALRSVRLAVLALLPTLLSIGLVLGAMGWLGIKIDLSTAFVASIATGLSVDDTFHCLLRWKRELRAGHSPVEALKISYAGAGPGVVLSSAAVSLGFLALIFSEFIPTLNFGWLVAVATLGGSLGNLVVLPACLAVVQWRQPKVSA